MQETKKYNFQNPEIQAKAVRLASFSARPTTYVTKKKIALEIKRELIKEEILKQGFLEQVGPYLDQITSVMVENAKTPEGHKDRKMILSAVGILGKSVEQKVEEEPREYFSLKEVDGN